jgi:hypothetical protein
MEARLALLKDISAPVVGAADVSPDHMLIHALRSS